MLFYVQVQMVYLRKMNPSQFIFMMQIFFKTTTVVLTIHPKHDKCALWPRSCFKILIHFCRQPAIILKLRSTSPYVAYQISSKGAKSHKSIGQPLCEEKRLPQDPTPPLTPPLPLWFLSRCCSRNFCQNHCHRDRRYSKIASLLDLPGMEEAFYPPLFFYSLSILLYGSSCKATGHMCIAFHSAKLLWLRISCQWKCNKSDFQVT